MVRLIGALMLVLVLVTPSFGQQSLVGTYKLVSVERILDGKPEPQPAKLPHGYLIITPTICTLFYTDGDRKYGASAAERAALWDTMTVYSGPYRFDGKKLTISVDTSWNEIYNGTQLVRDVEVRDKRLIMSSGPRPWGRDPSKTVVLSLTCEKIE